MCSGTPGDVPERGWPIAGRPPLGCFRCVGTEEPRAAALARVDDVDASRLLAGLDDAFALVAGRFFRREVRVRARACLAGMLSGLERKTGWSLAEHAGDRSPDGMQRLFATARWDPDLVRDDIRGYVAAALGDPGGVLIGDDTGFGKKGACSAGVQRHYTGTAGRSRTAAGVPPVPHAPPGPARRPRQGRGSQVERGGVLPGRQERGRPRPLPGRPLPRLVPVRHPDYGSSSSVA